MRCTRHATRPRPAGYVLGAELRACGVDLSFTPVLDLDHGASSVIGDRAFHRDPRVVTLLAKSLMHGLLRAGMANCGKHFPGHGYVRGRHARGRCRSTSARSKAILADDARPYDWLVDHARQRDAGARDLSRRSTPGRPASRRAGCSDILRGQLGFDRRRSSATT